jgi:hypothetical protein
MDRKDSSEVRQYAKENPYNVPEVAELMDDSLWQQDLVMTISESLIPKIQGTDCLSKLPWETFEAIAINLSTRDAFSLSRASKAFLPLLTSQAFWASRFKPGQDRSFIFEIQNNKERRDWLRLYRMTNYANNSLGLKNRRRVWKLIQNLVNLLPLCLDGISESSRTNLNANNLRWSEVTGDIRQETCSGNCELFNEGCRLFRRQCASIPNHLSRIAFSIVEDGEMGYVAGIRFMASNGADVRLGYTLEGREVFLEVTAVKGFVLAMGSRGVQALQVLSSDGSASKWFGCPKDSPVTERLAGFPSISALEVGVDVSSPAIPLRIFSVAY